MHKQKITSKIRSAKWFAMLLLFLATMVMQTLPFVPASKAKAEDIPDVTKVEWVSSSVIKVTVTSSTATFSVGSNTYNVKDSVAGLYSIQNGVRDASGIDTTTSKVYVLSPQSKYQCEDAGHIESKNQSSGANRGNYSIVDDDTTRILVLSQDQVSLNIHVKDATKNQCYSPGGGSIKVPIATASGSAGNALLGRWLDSANIQLDVGAPGIFHISPTNSKQFISTASGQGSCKDVIEITGDDTDIGTPVTFYDQKRGSDSPVNKSCGLDVDCGAGYISNTDQAKTAPAGSGLSTADGADVAKSCESSGSGILNWLFCAIIDGVDGTLNAVDGIVNNMLSVDAASIANNPKMYTLWSYFRNIASLLLVVVALVMIISQSLGNS
jgi:hypothetical protein